MRDNVELQNIVELYKKEKITRYVLEREIANSMSDKTQIRVVDVNAAKSFCVMAFPKFLSDGFNVQYFISDKFIQALDGECFVKILNELDMNRQTLLRKFSDFLKDTNRVEVSLSMAIGFILDTYMSYSGIFNIEGKDLNLEIDELQKLVDKFNMEQANEEDRECLALSGIMTSEMIELCRNYTHLGDEGKVKLLDSDTEFVETNFWFKRAQDLCTSTRGTRDHKEISDEYRPSTNQ